jgi:outer membrane protein insertion porin family
MISKGKLIKSLVLALLLSLSFNAAFAKKAKMLQNTKKPTLSNVTQSITKQDSCKLKAFVIEGAERVSKLTIERRSTIKLNDSVDLSSLNDLEKSIYSSGDFDDVSLSLSEDCVITIKVSEKPIVNKIEFIGNKKLPSSSLTSELQTKEKKVLSKEDLFFDQQRLKFIYLKTGFLNSNLDIYSKDVKGNKVDIFFDIKEGEVGKIGKIILRGNNDFTKKELINNTSIRDSGGIRLFTSKSNYDEQKIQLIQEELRTFYLQRGYVDFAVKSLSSTFSGKDDFFNVYLSITEGPKYRINNITFTSEIEGFKNIEAQKDIAKLIKSLKSTKFYNESEVFTLKQAIEYKLSLAGYATTIVEKQISTDPAKKLVNINFAIKQTDKLYINKITIVGNSKTNDNVIRRELLIHEGDVYNVALIRDSIQNIRYLGFVKNVELNEAINTEGKNLVDLEFKIEEGPTGSINLSAGYNNFDKLMGSLSYNQQNIFGRGYNSSIAFEQSRYRRNIMLSFTNPRVFDTHLLLGGSVAKVKSDNQLIQTYSQNSDAASVDFGYNISRRLRHIWTYSYRDDRMQMMSGVNLTPAMSEQIGLFKTSVLTHSLIYDKRNNQIMPTKGFMVRFNQGYAGLSGNIKYLSQELMSSFHAEIFNPNFVFSIIAKTGSIRGIAGSQVNIKDRFFFGMAEMRGFDFNGIGPRQATIDSKGNVTGYPDFVGLRGNNYTYISFEQTFPNFIPKDMGFKSYVFLDYGTVYGIDTKINNPNYKILDSSSFRSSYGVGLTWQSPMGPIGFDYGVAQNYQSFDQKRNFRLNIGVQRFMM